MLGGIWGLALAAGCAVVLANHLQPAGIRFDSIRGVDGVGYFAMTHSLVFDRDLDFTNQYAHLNPSRRRHPWFNPVPETGRPGNPWPIGYPLFQVPFLALGHVATLVAYGESNGYAGPAATSYFLGNPALLGIGATCLFLFLASFLGAASRPAGTPGFTESAATQRRAERVAFFAVLAIWPTTSLGYYTFSNMAHVAAFAAVSFFLFAWWRAREGNGTWAWALCGLALGLAFLARWQYAIVALIPIVDEAARALEARRSRSQGERVDARTRWLRARAIAVATAALTALPQLLAWKAIYGSWLTLPQGDAFLEFPPDRFLHVLFSTKHGWFVWTPMSLVGMLGLAMGIRRHPVVCASSLLVVLCQAALLGSLPYSWHNHVSFGIRALTGCVPFIAIGLALMMSRGHTFVIMGIVATCLLAVYTLLFAAQYRLGLVPAVDRLTAQELFIDKLDLRVPLARKRAAAHAGALIEAGAHEAAIDVAAAAIARHGADRELLRVLSEAYGGASMWSEAKTTREQLKKLLDSRLR